MTQRFERITIIGLGLLGGSVALASKSRGIARTVVGVTRRQETLTAAVRDGAVDLAGSDIAEGVRGAELVVLPEMPTAAEATSAASFARGSAVVDTSAVDPSAVDPSPSSHCQRDTVPTSATA